MNLKDTQLLLTSCILILFGCMLFPGLFNLFTILEFLSRKLLMLFAMFAFMMMRRKKNPKSQIIKGSLNRKTSQIKRTKHKNLKLSKNKNKNQLQKKRKKEVEVGEGKIHLHHLEKSVKTMKRKRER